MEDIYENRKGKADIPHRHDYYTILLVKDGNGNHIIDFMKYPLSSNQVYFVSPGQVHQVVEKEKSYGFSIVFSEQFLISNNIPTSFIEDLKLFQEFGETPPLTISKLDLNKLSNYSEEILKYYYSEDKFKDMAIGSLLKLFLINCNNICTLDFDNPQNIEAGQSILKNFRRLVDKNFTSWHTTSQYANELFITPDHLNRSIKNLTGKTAKEYIQSRITTEAKRLLYFTDHSAKEIGYELGFSEPANFSAFFKKCTGFSPSQFKNMT